MRRWLILLMPVALWMLLIGCGGTGTQAPPANGGRALQLVGEPTVVQLGQENATISGRIKNVAQRPYSGQVTLTMFDGAGKILNTAYGGVLDLQPGEEATYSSTVSTRGATWNKVEARVSVEIPR